MNQSVRLSVNQSISDFYIGTYLTIMTRWKIYEYRNRIIVEIKYGHMILRDNIQFK